MTTPASRTLDFLVTPARHPWRTLLVILPLVAAAALQTAQLRPVASLRNITAGDDPAAQALTRIVERFHVTDELLILAAWPAGRGGDAADVQTRLLAFANRLATARDADPVFGDLCGPVYFHAPPDVRAFIEQVIVPRALHYLDDAAIAALRRRLTPDDMRGQIRRHEQSLAAGGSGIIAHAQMHDLLGLRDILAPPIMDRWQGLGGVFSGSALSFDGDGALFTPDGRALLIRVQGKKPVSDLDYARALTHAVRDQARELNTDGLTLDFAGAYPIAELAERSIRADMMRSILVALIFLFLLFLFAFRDLWSFPLAMIPVACGCVLAFAVYASFATELTPLSAAIGAVLAGLGVDYAIHVLAHYRHARREGLDPAWAVRRLLGSVGPAMLIACGTSVLGLLVVARSQVPALREFALLGALGLAGSLLMAVTLLPALLVIHERPRRYLKIFGIGKRMSGSSSLIKRLYGTMAFRFDFSTFRLFDFLSSFVLAALFIAAFTMTLLNGWPDFEDDLTVLHPRPNPPLDAQRHIAEQFENLFDPLLVHLQAESPNELVSLAHEAQRRLRHPDVGAAGVSGVHSLATWLPDPRHTLQPETFFSETEITEILADFDMAIADSLFEPSAFDDYRSFLNNLLGRSPAPSRDDIIAYPDLARILLPRRVAGGMAKSRRAGRSLGDHSAAIPILRAHFACEVESLAMVFVDQPGSTRAERDHIITTVRAALRDLNGAVITGPTVVSHDAAQTIQREMARVVEPSTALVLLWVLLYFRRVGASCLAVLPAVAGFVTMIAAMHLLHWKLNVINLLGVAIFAGIGVDNGVLLVSLSLKWKRHVGAADDLHGAWYAALSAMSLTTLSTVLSFAALCWTGTPAIQSLGATVTIGMSAAWLASVGLLAPLLRPK